MYTYSRMADDLAYLGYSGIDVGSAGLSALGLTIPYVHTGEYSGAQVIITGGIHARENVTALLVMRQAFRAAFSRRAFSGGIYFLPLLNPDGAVLIEKGLSADKKRAELLLKANGGSNDFSLWKANINGVDLNNNFDAGFGEGKGQAGAPAPQGYPGEFPFSQPETAALKLFTLSVRPQITLSYHALGREIYWYYFQSGKDYERDLAIARRLEQVTGYRREDGDLGSTGGYKDWCVSYLKIPSFTLEIIPDSFSHPLKTTDLEGDWEQNKDIPFLLSEIAQTV